ncbi:MAG: hypothetical protein HXY20_14810 [Acidobacteria bacterium]|nr:hypothetical protein [Acidobacteriota bacterium]
MKRMLVLPLAGLAGLAVLLSGVPAKEEKLKPEDLVARHLAALGSAEARARVMTRTVAGTTTFTVRLGGHGLGDGSANILSDRKRTRIGLRYTAIEYPGEQLAFDGERISAGFVQPGQRSPLSQFVYHHDVMMREGLLGGALNAAWALLGVADRRPKLASTGLKKIEGERLYELRYRSRRGEADLQISLYFEPETFRHVLTQYRLTQPSGMPPAPGLTGPRDAFHTLVEQFGDFREVDGLTLPHSYKLAYTIEGPRSTYLAWWSISEMKILHNLNLEDSYFAVQ